MTSIADLEAATLLVLDVSFHWDTRAPDDDAPLLTDSGDAIVTGVGFAKKPGTLDFVLDAQKLQLPVLLSPLPILMTGTMVDASHVRWAPSLPNGPVQAALDRIGTVTVDGVGGQITAALTTLDPPLSAPAAPRINVSSRSMCSSPAPIRAVR